ncbi:DUF4279 domain-containing protein [Micromonospora musae]|uniref:DUF4279 domain-containing protein n=1 Tax=Micromonospora musae TaxID=1894970 RepID=UPI00342B3D2F
MLISQYAYFKLASVRVSAAEISARLGVEPDEVRVRGSRLAQPPRPATHMWQVVCREPGLMVDEQIKQIVDRLYPHADRIGALAAERDRIDGGPGASTLQVVRVFEHPNGKEEDLTSPVEGFEKLPGQHHQAEYDGRLPAMWTLLFPSSGWGEAILRGRRGRESRHVPTSTMCGCGRAERQRPARAQASCTRQTSPNHHAARRLVCCAGSSGG